jgi:hypothetical protein
LISIIRLQSHLAMRVSVSTEELTPCTRLLDLCNVSLVHRFKSPAWFKVIREHVAGAYLSQQQEGVLFEAIVGLKTGEAVVFCPSALVEVRDYDNVAQPLKDGVRSHLALRCRTAWARSCCMRLRRGHSTDTPT